MNFYIVRYDGLWIGGMGGIAVVAADSEAEAVELVRSHKDTRNFEGYTCDSINAPGPCVLYNDNGDY